MGNGNNDHWPVNVDSMDATMVVIDRMGSVDRVTYRRDVTGAVVMSPTGFSRHGKGTDQSSNADH
jgi:hypothetical protein